MPLHDDVTDKIREQLHRLARNEHVPIIEIGYLTYQQHQHVCAARKALGLPQPESPNIVYLGRHHYDSRSKQGYTIDDMVLQVQACTAGDCEVLINRRMTVLRSPLRRPDGYGNQVRDEGIFELARRKPRVELFSVVPKGDLISPLQKQQSPG